MLVTLAVLLLMMTAIVKIFQAATGALSSAQAYQELDNQLRLLDVTMRSDLNGITAQMTPPNDPRNNKGYFEYGENEFADIQGEDSDDYIRFTAKAPLGRPFTGRVFLQPPFAMSAPQPQIYLSTQPITITSEYAEIIYFLRNGNLYRRVFLIVPERQSTIYQITAQTLASGSSPFTPTAFGAQLSWQGVNDLSARPGANGNSGQPIVLNTLGDLTNRENRFAYQRFVNDLQDLTGAIHLGGDGLADDYNGDNVPDYYTTLYPQALNPVNAANANQLVFEPGYPVQRRALIANPGVLAFPYVFPGAYSIPQVISNDTYGWIHSPEPQVAVGPTPVPFEGSTPYTTLDYLSNLNHNPIDLGDNLPIPYPFGNQTWWGFPTWRETLSPNWNDPTYTVNGSNLPSGALPQKQPNGLSAYSPASGTVNTTSGDMLPPMNMNTPPVNFSLIRRNPQSYCDGAGANSLFWGGAAVSELPLWSLSWEDDLIMTGVRSFDIKAYDNALGGYADLGWGDNVRDYPLSTTQNPKNQTNLPFLNGTPNPNLLGNPGFTPKPSLPGFTPYLLWNNQLFDLINQTFAHEGRIPPLVEDNRYDAQFGPAFLNTYLALPTTPRTTQITQVTWATTRAALSGSGASGTPGPQITPTPPRPGCSPAWGSPGVLRSRRQSTPRIRRPTRRRCGASRSRFGSRTRRASVSRH